MMFDIYADSSANVPEEFIQKYRINIITYLFTVNGVEKNCYESGKPFEEVAKEFYKLLGEGASVTTSLVTKERIIEAVTPSLEAGRDALMITIASGISGTHAQALLAAEELNAKYPNNKLYVCDSANASMGQGLLVLRAAELRDMGESCEACAEWINNNAYKINAYVIMDDLKLLRKSGRISATLAIAGTILNIKPIIKADGGKNAKLVFYSKERGRKRAMAAQLKAFDELADGIENNHVAITHADCLDDALYLKSELEKRGVKDIIIEYYDLCTGSHVGPGTMALFFTGKDRRAGHTEAVEKKKKHGKAATQRA